MKEKLRNWISLLPLLLLLAATYWLSSQVQSPSSGAKNNQRHDTDYVVDNFTATSLDKQGKIRFVMTAKKMWHYPDDDTTHLELPKLTSLAAEYPPVRMSALTGEISGKGEEIFLRNDVTIVRPTYKDQSELTFTSNYLRVLPNKDIADTDQPITMVDAQTTVNAVGMELNNQTHIVKFLSQVKSVYERPKK